MKNSLNSLKNEDEEEKHLSNICRSSERRLCLWKERLKFKDKLWRKLKIDRNIDEAEFYCPLHFAFPALFWLLGIKRKQPWRLLQVL